MKRIFILSVITLAGCSTDVVPPNQAKLAPAERVYKYQHKSESPSALTVVRDSGVVGGACLASVYIDGERVASLKPKEKATFYIGDGERAVGASFEGSGLCAYNHERQERYISIKVGESKAVRIYTDSEANMDIRPTTL